MRLPGSSVNCGTVRLRGSDVRTIVVVGSGAVWVRRRHGGWRRIDFGRLADVLGLLGASTTVPRPITLLAPQVIPGPDADTPRMTRAGPSRLPAKCCGP
jgi:hypothetical protein